MTNDNTVSGSVTTPAGFTASALAAGIKPSGKPDMALLVNNGPEFTAAAVFTRNKVCAAPVRLCREVIANGNARAVLYNAGNANACTGEQGNADAKSLTAQVAGLLSIDVEDVAMCSTGLIGERLPVDRMAWALPTLVQGLGDHGDAAAQAIMTTDTVDKQALYQGSGWSIAAMGKGAGMMAPSLATMLVGITTDASVDPAMAHEALKNATAMTFDRLDIDGSTSTNDTVILMASGASGFTPSAEEFAEGLQHVCSAVAEMMQADAEGVTKRVSIEVCGTGSDEQALNAARTIARDNLVKCALFGSDPNWGRVLAAVGMADADMDPQNISVWFNGHAVCLKSGGTADAREVDLSGSDIEVRVDLGTGGAGTGRIRTTDLSLGYVQFNSAYTT